MAAVPHLAWEDDPLALDPRWSCGLSLLPLQEALDRTLFRSGLSREAWLRRLAGQLHAPALLPLLWLLPRGWRLAPAALPPRLRALASLLEQGVLSPSLLAALVDDLAHLFPARGGASALELWSRDRLRFGGQERAIAASAAALDALLVAVREETEGAWRDPAGGPGGGPATGSSAVPEPVRDGAAEPLFGGLVWRNTGLRHGQGPAARRANTELAQVLNRLAANQQSGADPWGFAGCRSGRAWIEWLMARGWRLEGRLRASVASFGFGASLRGDDGGWSQVPLALPLRTGLLDGAGEETMALLPHAALELRLDDGRGAVLRLQYYQGTEGLCGWEGLNDLHRPWQNDPDNGTVRYLGEPLRGEALLDLIDLSEVMALLHNRLASGLALRGGGYGPLGFCIDTTALLQLAISGRCELFPLMLSGVWRERLLRASRELPSGASLAPGGAAALERYRRALEQLPLDLSHHGSRCAEAWRRLRAGQPRSSPFRLVERLHSVAL